jgi:hypothetical protein
MGIAVSMFTMDKQGSEILVTQKTIPAEMEISMRLRRAAVS